jgi:hypothetical protein
MTVLFIPVVKEGYILFKVDSKKTPLEGILNNFRYILLARQRNLYTENSFYLFLTLKKHLWKD